MATPVFGNFGIRRLIDQNQRFMRAGLAASLRIKNFQDTSAVSEMGFQYVPPVTGNVISTGTTDIAITPPPSIRLMNMKQLEAAIANGVNLRAGARAGIVSHTWVLQQMQSSWFMAQLSINPSLNPNDFELVWRLPCVVGLITDNLLLDIVDVTHEDAYGQPMEWHLLMNASQLSKS